MSHRSVLHGVAWPATHVHCLCALAAPHAFGHMQGLALLHASACLLHMCACMPCKQVVDTAIMQRVRQRAINSLRTFLKVKVRWEG